MYKKSLLLGSADIWSVPIKTIPLIYDHYLREYRPISKFCYWQTPKTPQCLLCICNRNFHSTHIHYIASLPCEIWNLKYTVYTTHDFIISSIECQWTSFQRIVLYVQNACSKCSQTAAMYACSLSRYSLIAVSITRRSRQFHSSWTRCRSSSTSLIWFL